MKRLFLSVCCCLGMSISYAAVSDIADNEKCVEAMQNGHYDVAVQQCEYESEKGNAEAAEILGYIYLKGKSGSRDWGQAKKYLEMALDGGRVTAGKYLAVLYWNGLGVQRSHEKAMELFNDCIQYERDNGGVDCKVQLAKTLSFGTNTKDEHRYAKDIYAELVSNGYYEYSLELAKIHKTLGNNDLAYRYAEFFIWWAKRYGTVEHLNLINTEANMVKNSALGALSNNQVNEAYTWVKNEIFRINEEHLKAQQTAGADNSSKQTEKSEAHAGDAANP